MKNMTYIAIATAILAVILLIRSCSLSNKVDEQESLITTEKLENQKLTTVLNEQKQTIYKQQVIVTQSQESINQLADSVFKLKKKDAKNTETIAYFRSHIKVKVDTLRIPYEVPRSVAERLKFSDSIIQACSDVIEILEANSIPVPAIAKVSNSMLTLHATVKKEGLQIDHLEVPDTINVRFVERKRGFLKKPAIEVQFFHTNPLFTTENTNSAIYIPKKKSFIQRVLLPVAVGVGAGLLIAK